ncbi:MAG: hypothetical protein HZB29_10150 [Nitrospinae bacterium]|nr:hypothetical protein [Nitrospinota bacterium]
MRITFEAKLPASLKKEGDIVISHCPALDVWSQGNNQKEALKNLIEAVHLFLVSCYERGTLDKALKECGFKPAKQVKAKPFPHGYKSITVPLPFEYSGKLSQCSV